MKWIQWLTEMLDDPILDTCIEENGALVLAVYATIITLYGTERKFSKSTIKAHLRLRPSKIEALVTALINCGLVRLDMNNNMVPVNFEVAYDNYTKNKNRKLKTLENDLKTLENDLKTEGNNEMIATVKSETQSTHKKQTVCAHPSKSISLLSSLNNISNNKNKDLEQCAHIGTSKDSVVNESLFSNVLNSNSTLQMTTKEIDEQLDNERNVLVDSQVYGDLKDMADGKIQIQPDKWKDIFTENYGKYTPNGIALAAQGMLVYDNWTNANHLAIVGLCKKLNNDEKQFAKILEQFFTDDYRTKHCFFEPRHLYKNLQKYLNLINTTNKTKMRPKHLSKSHRQGS